MQKIIFAPDVKKIVDRFVDCLQSAHKEDLISVIVYGSSVNEDLSGAYSDINVLVVLGDTSIVKLAGLSGFVRKRIFRRLHPLFLTQTYIERSLDVFPIEFLDMQENYCVVFGKDVLAHLSINTKNLRFQCEHELKAKFLITKHAYLYNSDKNARKRLLFKSFSSAMHVIRGFIRLQKDQKTEYRTKEMFVDIAKLFAIDTSTLEKIYTIKHDGQKISASEIDLLFVNFINDLEKIIDVIDRY